MFERRDFHFVIEIIDVLFKHDRRDSVLRHESFVRFHRFDPKIVVVKKHCLSKYECVFLPAKSGIAFVTQYSRFVDIKFTLPTLQIILASFLTIRDVITVEPFVKHDINALFSVDDMLHFLHDGRVSQSTFHVSPHQIHEGIQYRHTGGDGCKPIFAAIPSPIPSHMKKPTGDKHTLGSTPGDVPCSHPMQEICQETIDHTRHIMEAKRHFDAEFSKC